MAQTENDLTVLLGDRKRAKGLRPKGTKKRLMMFKKIFHKYRFCTLISTALLVWWVIKIQDN